MRTVYHLLVQRSRSLSRALVAALVLASLLAGVVEMHAASEALGDDPLHTGGLPELCHPGLAVHVEPARDPEPPCLACLLRLVGQGALLASPTSRFEILPLGLALHPTSTFDSSSPIRLPVSRGPPAA